MMRTIFTFSRHKIFYVLLFTLIWAGARAQSVSLDIQNKPLSEVLNAITKASGYKFVYSDALDTGTPVTVKCSNEPLVQVLEQIFKDQNISYRIEGKNIALTPARFASRQTPEKTFTLSGIITDDNGEPLPGVTIHNKTKNKASASDLDGKYQIEASQGDELEFTSIGMMPMKLMVARRAVPVNVALKTDAIALSDVIVTGYQTLSRERSTGSYSVVTAQKLENKLQPSLTSILEGQSAGVVLTKDGNLEIRGVSTIQGVSTPLIVVDGYPLIGEGVGLESVNPDNIETITVLKDAVAASIYGARASNGVIVITTKSASRGAFSVSYKGSYGITLKPELSKLNLAGVQDYMEAEADLYQQETTYYNSQYNSYNKMSDYMYLLMAKENGTLPADRADAQIEALKKNNALQQIQKYLIRPKQMQQHNVSLSGGSDKNMFNGVVRYVKEYQNLIQNDDSRFIVDLNNTWKPKEWFTLRIFSNFNYSKSNRTDETYETLTDFSSTSRVLPYTQLYDAGGNPTPWSPVGQRRLDTYATYPGMKPVTYHPESDLPLYMNETENLQIRLGGDLSVKFCDFLTASVGGSWIQGSSKYRSIADENSFNMRTAYNDGTSPVNSVQHYIPEGGKIDENRTTINAYVIRGQLNYNQSFNEARHRVTAMLGSEISKDTYETTYLPTRLGYNPVSATYNSGFNPHDYNNNKDNMSGDMLFNKKPANLGTIDYGKNYGVRDNRFVSWYGNASYEYNSRYLVTASARLDLTNFFGTDPKFRYKPTWSVGGTYKISEETYFENLKTIFNRFNLRASYGINGNISLNNTPFLILSVGTYNPTTGGISYGINSYPNNQLRWERTLILDIGLDISMLNDRINFSFDFYNKKSKDLIASDAVDQTKGTSSLPQNVGELSNRGFELTVNSEILRKKNFTWASSLIASYNTSNVDYYNVTRSYFGSYATPGPILVEGYPMDGFWGGRFAQINDQGIALFYNAKGEKVEGGSLKAEDAVFLGTARPKLDMSWTNSFRYKNIEASFMFIAKFGHKYRKDSFTGSNYNNRHVSERWREKGDEKTTIYPRLLRWNMDMFYYPYSDILMGNANYLKLRDLTLTYHLPKNIVNRMGLTGLKVYFQTRNLFYITAKGVDIDPETAEYNTSGGTGAFTNQGYTSLQLRPEFYFGLTINL